MNTENPVLENKFMGITPGNARIPDILSRVWDHNTISTAWKSCNPARFGPFPVPVLEELPACEGENLTLRKRLQDKIPDRILFGITAGILLAIAVLVIYTLFIANAGPAGTAQRRPWLMSPVHQYLKERRCS